MIYILIGVALFVLLVWVGRRARPLLQQREMKILAGSIGGAIVAAGGLLAASGRYLPGAILSAVGVGLVFIGRGAPARPADPTDDAAISEAREILGVGPDATREEIQAAYGRLIRAVHPDAGGTSGLAARLNAARDTLLKK